MEFESSYFLLNYSGKDKVYVIIFEKIESIPHELIDFRYELKMSIKDRKLLENKQIGKVKGYFYRKSTDYAEIFKAGGADKGDISMEIRESLMKLKDLDFERLHGSLVLPIKLLKLNPHHFC